MHACQFNCFREIDLVVVFVRIVSLQCSTVCYVYIQDMFLRITRIFVNENNEHTRLVFDCSSQVLLRDHAIVGFSNVLK